MLLCQRHCLPLQPLLPLLVRRSPASWCRCCCYRPWLLCRHPCHYLRHCQQPRLCHCQLLPPQRHSLLPVSCCLEGMGACCCLQEVLLLLVPWLLVQQLQPLLLRLLLVLRLALIVCALEG